MLWLLLWRNSEKGQTIALEKELGSRTAEGYELDAIAAAVLGGTSLSGGYGTIIGTFIGAIIMGIINNGMNLVGMAYFYQQIVKGLIILIAVYLDIRNKSKMLESKGD